jgi:hypothetical protein
MRLLVLLTLVVASAAPEAQAQLAVELLYGAERNVESASSEVDGWMNGTVEWVFPSGLGLGLGTDHQFEDASVSPSSHQSWAIYVSSSLELPLGQVAPFVRGGIGRLVGEFRLLGEIGVSRVSRPFGGAGVSFRF